jgi:hypothetical protein
MLKEPGTDFEQSGGDDQESWNFVGPDDGLRTLEILEELRRIGMDRGVETTEFDTDIEEVKAKLSTMGVTEDQISGFEYNPSMQTPSANGYLDDVKSSILEAQEVLAKRGKSRADIDSFQWHESTDTPFSDGFLRGVNRKLKIHMPMSENERARLWREYEKRLENTK